MKKFCLPIVVILMATAPAFAQDTRVRCESNGKLRQCGFAGTGTVTLMRQLSKDACVQGKSWGYNGDTIWVDRGCRADFLVSPHASSIQNAAVVCESQGGRRTCAADTRFGVHISRQLSKHGCMEGKDWGYTRNGIWVDRGCRAEFIVGPGPMSGGMTSGVVTNNYHGSVVCESQNNVRHRCSADTRFGVQLGRQMSDNNCILNKTWGWDSRGIWVSKGCRAEFILGTQ